MKKASAKEVGEAIKNNIKKDFMSDISLHDGRCPVWSQGMDDGLSDCECFCKTPCQIDKGHCDNCHGEEKMHEVKCGHKENRIKCLEKFDLLWKAIEQEVCETHDQTISHVIFNLNFDDCGKCEIEDKG